MRNFRGTFQRISASRKLASRGISRLSSQAIGDACCFRVLLLEGRRTRADSDARVVNGASRRRPLRRLVERHFGGYPQRPGRDRRSERAASLKVLAREYATIVSAYSVRRLLARERTKPCVAAHGSGTGFPPRHLVRARSAASTRSGGSQLKLQGYMRRAGLPVEVARMNLEQRTRTPEPLVRRIAYIATLILPYPFTARELVEEPRILPSRYRHQRCRCCGSSEPSASRDDQRRGNRHRARLPRST